MTTERRPVVAALVALIDEHDWHARFELAVAQLRSQRVEARSGIRTLDDYFAFLDDMVVWAPREQHDSLQVHDKLVAFHFMLDQPALARCSRSLTARQLNPH